MARPFGSRSHAPRPGGGDCAGAPTAWPGRWARCWSQIRTWHVPPRWSFGDWCDEARGQGALADLQSRREFDPRRGVPLDAFLDHPRQKVIPANRANGTAR